jgi:hypothetical protein
MALRQELQIYGLWAGKQTAKGTALVAPAKRFKQVAGGFNVVREDGSENYSDATQFPSTTDWINTMSGNGQPGIEATPEELAWMLWAAEGGETTSAVTGPPAKTKHTAVPLPGLGHWHDWTDRQGSQVIDRWRHNDCQISQLQVEGSTANKAVRVTPSIVSLDPGEQVAPTRSRRCRRRRRSSTRTAPAASRSTAPSSGATRSSRSSSTRTSSRSTRTTRRSTTSRSATR